jgi:hypothetical protein
MLNILIAILQVLGVFATPELMNNADFLKQNENSIKRAETIYNTNSYHIKDGGVIVDNINP